MYLRVELLKYLFLLLEESFYLVVGDDAFLEHVGTGLLRLDHLDALGELLTRAGFQVATTFFAIELLYYLISR